MFGIITHKMSNEFQLGLLSALDIKCISIQTHVALIYYIITHTFLSIEER